MCTERIKSLGAECGPVDAGPQDPNGIVKLTLGRRWLLLHKWFESIEMT